MRVAGWAFEPRALERFFRTARERHAIHNRRAAGLKPPWTDDPIFQQHRFCNVFRELDRTTRWFAPHRAAAGTVFALQATAIFRAFNRIETGEILVANNLLLDWDEERARAVLRDVHPVVTGAYMVKTPARMSKLEGVLKILRPLLEDEEIERVTCAVAVGHSLQAAAEHLQQYPYFGPFVSYEVVSDLRHTALLANASDIMTWANAGPGAAHGAEVLLGVPRGSIDRNSPEGKKLLLRVMKRLLALSKAPEYWPQDWPAWEMREPEHWLCEFDKYERLRTGAAAHIKRRGDPAWARKCDEPVLR